MSFAKDAAYQSGRSGRDRDRLFAHALLKKYDLSVIYSCAQFRVEGSNHTTILQRCDMMFDLLIRLDHGQTNTVIKEIFKIAK